MDWERAALEFFRKENYSGEEDSDTAITAAMDFLIDDYLKMLGTRVPTQSESKALRQACGEAWMSYWPK